MLLLILLKATDCAVRPLTAVFNALKTDTLLLLDHLGSSAIRESRKRARTEWQFLAVFPEPIHAAVLPPGRFYPAQPVDEPALPIRGPKCNGLGHAERSWPTACMLQSRHEKFRSAVFDSSDLSNVTASSGAFAATNNPCGGTHAQCCGYTGFGRISESV